MHLGSLILVRHDESSSGGSVLPRLTTPLTDSSLPCCAWCRCSAQPRITLQPRVAKLKVETKLNGARAGVDAKHSKSHKMKGER